METAVLQTDHPLTKGLFVSMHLLVCTGNRNNILTRSRVLKCKTPTGDMIIETRGMIYTVSSMTELASTATNTGAIKLN